MDLQRVVSPQDTKQLEIAEDRLREMGVDTNPDNPAYIQVIVDYLNANPGVQITADNIVNFVNTNKKLFNWRNQVQREYDALYPSFTQSQWDFIAGSLARYGYETSNEQDLLSNCILVARAFLARGYQVSPENFKIVIGNLLNSPQGQHLRWKTQPDGKKHFDAQA